MAGAPVTPQHEAALSYAQRGLFVFPCVPGAKNPIVSNGHLQATTDVVTINTWWTQHPNANVGVAVKPSGLVVLDVDVGKKSDGTSKRGRESLAEIDHALTDTLTSITGSGGLHAIYTRPPDVEPTRVIGFKDGLDLIGDGYIIVPPSVLADGQPYRWNSTAAIAPLPPILHNVRREKVQTTQAGVAAPLPEGGRNLAMFRLGCALRAQGLGVEALAAALYKENQKRCTPPLPDGELATVVDHVMQQVQPHRDAAAGAIVEQEIAAMHAPQGKAVRVGEYKPTNLTPQRFYPTSFTRLNDLIGGGLATRHHLGIIGPPSCGKSGFVNELVLEQQRHTPVLVYSAELPMEEVRVRLAARMREFAWRDGMRGAIQQDAISAAVRDLGVWIIGADEVDRESPLDQIYYEAERIRQATGTYPSIFEDYVQLLADGSEDKVRHKVGQLSKGFRIMSQRLDVPVVAVYSTSRTYYSGQALEKMRKANDPTAYLAAAKECGDIEYHCATLLYLDLDKLHEGTPKPARIAVARARVGDVGFVGARAQLDIGRWYGDPSALTEMSTEERTAKQNGQRLDQDCQRLLEVMRKLWDRPWREIRAASGLPFGAADIAKAHLLETGRIRMSDIEIFDGLHRRKKKGIIEFCDVVPAHDADQEE